MCQIGLILQNSFFFFGTDAVLAPVTRHFHVQFVHRHLLVFSGRQVAVGEVPPEAVLLHPPLRRRHPPHRLVVFPVQVHAAVAHVPALAVHGAAFTHWHVRPWPCPPWPRVVLVGIALALVHGEEPLAPVVGRRELCREHRRVRGEDVGSGVHSAPARVPQVQAVEVEPDEHLRLIIDRVRVRSCTA